MPFCNDCWSKPAELSKLTSPLTRLTLIFFSPFFSRYLLMVSAQVEQLIPSIFQLIVSIYVVHKVTDRKPIYLRHGTSFSVAGDRSRRQVFLAAISAPGRICLSWG